MQPCVRRRRSCGSIRYDTTTPSSPGQSETSGGKLRRRLCFELRNDGSPSSAGRHACTPVVESTLRSLRWHCHGYVDDGSLEGRESSMGRCTDKSSIGAAGSSMQIKQEGRGRHIALLPARTRESTTTHASLSLSLSHIRSASRNDLTGLNKMMQ
jgi:hypothetical protein